MSGEVEADETFIGRCRARFMHKDKRERIIKGRGAMGKTAVIGLLERHGEGSRVRTHVVEGTRKRHPQGHVRASVKPGATVHTDALRSTMALLPSTSTT